MASISEEGVIGKRFTLVIPKKVRKKLALKEGQRVLLGTDGGRLLVEPLPEDPYRVLQRVIGEPYDEAGDEKRAEEWLKKHAGR